MLALISLTTAINDSRMSSRRTISFMGYRVGGGGRRSLSESVGEWYRRGIGGRWIVDSGRLPVVGCRSPAGPAAALTPPPLTLLSFPPYSSLLPPFRGEVGRGGSPVPARKAVDAGLSPPAPLPGGRREGRALRLRPDSSPLTLLSSPLQGGGREGVPRADVRGGGRRGYPPPAPLPGGRREGGALRLRPDSSPLTLLSSPLQGGGREGGPPCRRAGRWAAGLSPRPPFQGGEEKVGRSASALTPPPLLFSPPPFRGEVGRGVPRAGARGGGRRGYPPPAPLPGGRSESGRMRVRPRRRTGRRTAAALTPPPFSSLLPPSGGRSGGGSPVPGTSRSLRRHGRFR